MSDYTGNEKTLMAKSLSYFVMNEGFSTNSEAKLADDLQQRLLEGIAPPSFRVDVIVTSCQDCPYHRSSVSASAGFCYAPSRQGLSAYDLALQNRDMLTTCPQL